MDMVFFLVEKLVALAHPTIVGLQSLLSVTLSPVNIANQYWSYYEAHPSSGLVASVEFREPVRGASKYKPLLVVTLRDAPVRLQDLSINMARAESLISAIIIQVSSATLMSCTAGTFTSRLTQRTRESWHYQSTTQQLHTAVRSRDHDAPTKNFDRFIDSCNLLQIGLQRLNRGANEDAGPHSFTDCSRPLAARVCSIQAGRSLSGFAPPVLSLLPREL